MKKNTDEIVEWDILIEPGRKSKNYWTDIWRFRELFYILSWRDIKVRYKQTILGAAWSVIRPLLTTLVFTIVFSKIANLNNPSGAPYALMVFTGMLPWQFFSNALAESSNSLIGNSNLITKVYFPRIIVPTSSIITGLVDFFISFAILLVMLVWYEFVPSWNMVFLPFFILLVFFIALGSGLLLTALNVKYRDFRYIIPFIIQFGLYISPVGFNSAVISEKWQPLLSLNPMTGIINGFRWCILGEQMSFYPLFLSVIITSLVVLFGIYYFRKMERSFADNI